MDFIEIEVFCEENFREIFMAELSEIDFNTFMETDSGFLAYIETDKFISGDLQNTFEKYSGIKVSYKVSHVKEKNWNEEWEKNYDPIIVEDKCLIHATFHNLTKTYPYEVLINPRMSFGTGHHETTYLMCSHQLDVEHTGKQVLDIGCGTGILAILASKRGAASVLAIDNNDWAYENAVDNVKLNLVSNVEVLAGSVNELKITRQFDLILANINRNVLLEELPTYTQLLTKEGKILLSGFYKHDEEDITNLMDQLGFILLSARNKNNWSALLFTRK